MGLTLTKEQNELADYMSKISERCYFSGWMKNLEYVLWDTIYSGPRKYGQDFITNNDISELLRLSGNANSWIIFDNEAEELALNLVDWKYCTIIRHLSTRIF